MASAAEMIEHMKECDRFNIGIVPLVHGDAVMSRLVASWISAARRLIPADPHEHCPDSIPASDRTAWLWARVEPEPVGVWIDVAGLPDTEYTRRAAKTLIDNCAVFPDGTMSAWLVRWLRNCAQSAGIAAEDIVMEMGM